VTPTTANPSPAAPTLHAAKQPTSAAYLRYPDIRGDLVVFTAADDIWAASRDGGRAWRLTDDAIPVAYPRISPDGRLVAYTQRRSGLPEVHVVEADGTGASRRITFWGNKHTRVAGWLPDGRIIVTTGHGAPQPQKDAQLWALDPDKPDTEATLLPFGRGSEVAIHEPSGTTVVVTMWRNNVNQWKHYQGGTAARLWVSHSSLPIDAPHEQHAKRTWEPLRDDLLANKSRVGFIGDRLIFASDTPGENADINDRASANLWSVALDGSDLRAHTHLRSEEGYLREPATDGERVVFVSRGRLFILDGLDAEPREIEIITPGVGAARLPRAIKPEDNLLALRPTHNAHASVVEWRGTVHALTHRGGPARLLAGTSGLRLREAAPLGDTDYAVFVTDESAQRDRTEPDAFEHRYGSDRIALRRVDAEGEQVTFDVGPVGRILHLAASPDGSRVAFVSHDATVRLLTLTADDVPQLHSVTELGRGNSGEIRDLAFSPDSRWLVWSQPKGEYSSQLLLVDTSAEDPTPRPITSGKYHDVSPVFTSDGLHMAFISARTFETAYDDMVFDLSFVNSQRPYLLPLTATTPDPFGPLVDGWGPASSDSHKPKGSMPDGGGQDSADGTKVPGASGADGHSAGHASSGIHTDDADDTPPETHVDWDYAADRVVPFPVVSSYYSSLTPVKTGVVWLHHPQEVAIGSSRSGVEDDDPAPSLGHWNLAEHKYTELAQNVSAVWASGDGEQLVILQDGDYIQIPSDHSVEDDDPAHIKIDLDRLSLTVDPVAERRGMLWENYRIMAQQYWRADMDGQDWHAMTSWYDEAIDRVVTDDDFVDLMWDVVGELGTSHAYVMPEPHPDTDASQAVATLGADLRLDGENWIIERILEGDSSDPDAGSPLRAPGVAARPGEAIVAVGGRPVDPAFGVGPLLTGAANRPTELVLQRTPADGGASRRRVVVKPLADENQLRYQEWVASRRAYVAERSGGRLGYLHIPDMVSTGWAQMHRDLREAAHCEAMVVDVRYNSGGHTSQLVTDRLARKVLSWSYPRGETPDTYPEFAPRGPVVLVTNQEAGSDGDIVGAVAKAMKIGPLVGLRTWGGVIGIDGRFDLVDGTGVTEPKYASWFAGVDWSIENYGVDPDIEVPYPPNLWLAGEDPQLARGVDEALAALEHTPTAVAPALPPKRFGN
jgi:tricorn protease